ncbi:MAG: FlgD immunoglobulin-like domain containing protein [Candidatus Marinimicrobia bacterium]|nr:FlgD immunoglobulin-like domain containing protein [Candidatus Neomarinimicrobiota bacterium]
MNTSRYSHFLLLFFFISFVLSDGNAMDPTFQFVYDNTDIEVSPDSMGSFDGVIHNLSSEVISLAIVRVANDLPEDWTSSICVGMTCYNTSIDSIEFDLDPSDSTACGLSIWTNGHGEGTIQLDVFDLDDQSEHVIVDITIHTSTHSSIIDNENKKSIADNFILSDNYPNPFNPVTSISYALVNSEMVKLSIYDMRGRLVRTLFRGNQILGYHTMDWNGTDGQGRPVSAGSYIYTIQVGNEVKTKKMTLLK